MFFHILHFVWRICIHIQMIANTIRDPVVILRLKNPFLMHTQTVRTPNGIEKYVLEGHHSFRIQFYLLVR